MESSIISAARTVASAAPAADVLSRGRAERPRRIGFFGTGFIARHIDVFLRGAGWTFESVGVHDLNTEYAESFADRLRRTGTPAGSITVHKKAEDLVRSADLVVFATVAGTPHVTDPGWFGHNPLVLHVSLRDLSPEIILASCNVVDDVEHCLKADTGKMTMTGAHEIRWPCCRPGSARSWRSIRRVGASGRRGCRPRRWPAGSRGARPPLAGARSPASAG